MIVIDPRVTGWREKRIFMPRSGREQTARSPWASCMSSSERNATTRSFVADWTVGFDKLVDHVKEYSPEKVEKITWVPAETIRRIARMYAENSPAGISPGWALDASSNGIQTMRAIGTLMAICGNLEIPGEM